jgi:hypothetical protein
MFNRRTQDSEGNHAKTVKDFSDWLADNSFLLVGNIGSGSLGSLKA